MSVFGHISVLVNGVSCNQSTDVGHIPCAPSVQIPTSLYSRKEQLPLWSAESSDGTHCCVDKQTPHVGSEMQLWQSNLQKKAVFEIAESFAQQAYNSWQRTLPSPVFA